VSSRQLHLIIRHVTRAPVRQATPGQTLRILLAPFQRLTDDFVLIRAGESLQKSLATFVINKRSERRALRTPPSVQLDRKVAVINAALKR
jgi:hypothetical protein